jgi:A/G-specific adenine glycosylase
MPQLLREIKKFYKVRGRHGLPWRATCDPYKILVSEVMLQQTQVERVIPFYSRFIKKFPTAQKLAEATLSDVLKAWQGLGYNRRAKYLLDSAKILEKKSSDFRPPDGQTFSQEFFATLPGVGPYTAAAVETFAFNKPNVFIETNIRTAFLYSDILKKTRISDRELLPLVEKALHKSNMPPREFYWALMDYGAALKKRGVKLNHRSAHYAKQSKFEGSRRQKRAARLRALLKQGAPETQLLKILNS